MQTNRKFSFPPAKLPHSARVIFILGAIAVVGFGIMYITTTSLLPAESSAWSSGLIMLMLVIVGIGAPYCMLKFGFHEAHRRNPQEQDIHIEDIPKDYDQVQKEKGRSRHTVKTATPDQRQ